MILIGLFTKYFLALMIIQGLIAVFVDAPSFKRNNMPRTEKKAKVLGIGSIVLGLVLFFIRMSR